MPDIPEATDEAEGDGVDRAANAMGSVSISRNGAGANEIPDMDEIPDMEEDLEEGEDEATAAPKAPTTASGTLEAR